jgi:hypothetical protein
MDLYNTDLFSGRYPLQALRPPLPDGWAILPGSHIL